MLLDFLLLMPLFFLILSPLLLSVFLQISQEENCVKPFIFPICSVYHRVSKCVATFIFVKRNSPLPPPPTINISQQVFTTFPDSYRTKRPKISLLASTKCQRRAGRVGLCIWYLSEVYIMYILILGVLMSRRGFM